ncbi:MAG TPA: hypothetical protein DEB09_01160 [Candidatus Magasanikbacteria bacterium]|nr:hypothetical protein [Candidatus Magasanikbacteria bacterium]
MKASEKLVEILRVSKEGCLKEHKKIINKEDFERLKYHLDHLSQEEIINWLFWPIARAQEETRTENIENDEALVRNIIDSVAAENLLDLKITGISEDSPVDPEIEATSLEELKEAVNKLLNNVDNVVDDKDKLPN